MNEHTKGEWKFNGKDIIVGQNIGQQRICTMIEHREEYKTEDEANARLIAAAPDLLAACEDFMELAEWDKEKFAYTVSDFCHSQIKKAIAKAISEKG